MKQAQEVNTKKKEKVKKAKKKKNDVGEGLFEMIITNGDPSED